MSRDTKAPVRPSLDSLAISARGLSGDLSKDDDWMSRVNAESLLALSALASGATASRASSLQLDRGHDSPNQLDISDFKAPLLAAVGAADAALERVNEIVAALGQRLDEALIDVGTRFDERVAHFNKLYDVLPSQIGALTEWVSSVEEFREFAERYADTVQVVYDGLIERGEAALERLGGPSHEKSSDCRAPRAPSPGERAAKLVGVELPKKAYKQATSSKKAVKKAPARKAPAKKAAVRRARQK